MKHHLCLLIIISFFSCGNHEEKLNNEINSLKHSQVKLKNKIDSLESNNLAYLKNIELLTDERNKLKKILNKDSLILSYLKIAKSAENIDNFISELEYNLLEPINSIVKSQTNGNEYSSESNEYIINLPTSSFKLAFKISKLVFNIPKKVKIPSNLTSFENKIQYSEYGHNLIVNCNIDSNIKNIEYKNEQEGNVHSLTLTENYNSIQVKYSNWAH